MLFSKDPKNQEEEIRGPAQLPPDVIVSPDTRRVNRVPPGQSRTRKRGSDVTVVAWGNTVEQCENALGGLSDVDVELMDLRSIVPWDRDGIADERGRRREVARFGLNDSTEVSHGDIA